MSLKLSSTRWAKGRGSFLACWGPACRLHWEKWRQFLEVPSQVLWGITDCWPSQRARSLLKKGVVFAQVSLGMKKKTSILSDNMIAKSEGFGQGKLSCVCLLLNPNLFSMFLWKIRGCYKLSHAIIDFSKHSTDINSGTLVSLRQRKKSLRGLLARAGRTGRQRWRQRSFFSLSYYMLYAPLLFQWLQKRKMEICSLLR